MKRLKSIVTTYPRQFWILFGGMLINAAGASMVWPFLTIYVRQHFDVPLTTVGLLLSLNSVVGLLATFVAGPVADRFGRKGVMLWSLFSSSLVFIIMIGADSLLLWAALMAARGAFNPLFRVGSNAMVADLISSERRSGAYALLRTSSNLGMSIGPAVGGFIAAVSYSWTFFIAGVAGFLFALLIFFLVTETLSQSESRSEAFQPLSAGSYERLLGDRPFLAFCGLSTLAVIPASLMMVLLPVYAKEQFGVMENQYGFIMTTNALMVVLLQYAVTRLTGRHRPLAILALGALFYGLGVGSVACGRGFVAFVLSMVVVTIGEMMLIPTSTTLTANMAPSDMRGRYMGVFGLTWGLGMGIGPVFGGYLNDHVAPVAIWHGGLVIGLAAALGFLLLARVREPEMQAA